MSIFCFNCVSLKNTIMPFRIRYIFALLICIYAFESCIQSTHTESKSVDRFIPVEGEQFKDQKFPKFGFNKEIHKFGEISEGEILVCEFYFKNIGDANLIINTIESSCGCTVVKWDKSPIKVGEESKILLNLILRIDMANNTRF